MRHLLLLRHAKTEPGGPGLSDRERSLTERGRRDAALMGTALVGEGMVPDLILCSPARRTQETLAALLASFATAPQTVTVDALYGSGAGDYVGTIAAFGGTAKRLLVIGHNPTIHATALALAGSGKKAVLARLAEKFPTAALAVIAFRGNAWADTVAGSGELLFVRRPRDLGGEADD